MPRVASTSCHARPSTRRRAAATRQTLALLSTVANVLVLVGLVGNFFGLADTVRQLPGLHRSQMAGVDSASGTTAPAPPVTETHSITVEGIPVTESTTRAPRAVQAPSFARKRSELQADGHLNKIAAALGVVVCSSVMGIFSMALPSFYVSLLRTRLTAAVETETAFLEAEVAPLLRRRADPADVFSSQPMAAPRRSWLKPQRRRRRTWPIR